MYRELDERPGLVATYNNLGVNAHLQGDYRSAAAHYQEAYGLARELEFSDLELVSLNNLAGAQVELGEYHQAETGLREILTRTEGASWFLLTEVYRFLALAVLGQGRFDEALAAGQQALDLARQAHSSEQVGRAWRVLGRIAAYNRTVDPAKPFVVDGRACDAHACYAAGLQAFVELGATGEQARTAREWAGYELEHGDPREGLRLWQEARDLFTRLGMQLEVERMDHHPAAHDTISSSD